MDRAEESGLVRKLISMDETAWERFCREYSRPLLKFLQFWFGFSQEEAEEVVQMTFIRCVRSIGTFKPSRGRLFEWLKTVSKNEAHTLIRRARRDNADVHLSSLPEHIADGILEEMDRAPLPDELLAREDVQLLIQEVLMELNSRYSQALVMKYAKGLTVSEIAAKLGVSEKAAESILSRAREAFRKRFLHKARSVGLERGEGADET